MVPEPLQDTATADIGRPLSEIASCALSDGTPNPVKFGLVSFYSGVGQLEGPPSAIQRGSPVLAALF
jgi:hypothetical protein